MNYIHDFLNDIFPVEFLCTFILRLKQGFLQKIWSLWKKTSKNFMNSYYLIKKKDFLTKSLRAHLLVFFIINSRNFIKNRRISLRSLKLLQRFICKFLQEFLQNININFLRSSSKGHFVWVPDCNSSWIS